MTTLDGLQSMFMLQQQSKTSKDLSLIQILWILPAFTAKELHRHPPPPLGRDRHLRSSNSPRHLSVRHHLYAHTNGSYTSRSSSGTAIAEYSGVH